LKKNIFSAKEFSITSDPEVDGGLRGAIIVLMMEAVSTIEMQTNFYDITWRMILILATVRT
jgi:hypothetical protein